jgi:hypothetical protein
LSNRQVGAHGDIGVDRLGRRRRGRYGQTGRGPSENQAGAVGNDVVRKAEISGVAECKLIDGDGVVDRIRNRLIARSARPKNGV